MTSIPAIQIPPEKLTELQAQYAQELQALWQQGLNASAPIKDRRFAAPAWQENPVAGFNAALYLLNARTLMALAEKVDTDEKTRARIQFAVEQWVAATSPRDPHTALYHTKTAKPVRVIAHPSTAQHSSIPAV